MRQARRRDAGFTLTELAVVMAVVALLLGMGMYTLGAQVEQRNRADTEHRSFGVLPHCQIPRTFTTTRLRRWPSHSP